MFLGFLSLLEIKCKLQNHLTYLPGSVFVKNRLQPDKVFWIINNDMFSVLNVNLYSWHYIIYEFWPVEYLENQYALLYG